MEVPALDVYCYVLEVLHCVLDTGMPCGLPSIHGFMPMLARLAHSSVTSIVAGTNPPFLARVHRAASKMMRVLDPEHHQAAETAKYVRRMLLHTSLQPTTADAVTCSICLNEAGADKVFLPCFHGFHLTCIEKWTVDTGHDECPVCKTAVMSSIQTLLFGSV
jgi:hypothetical protein